MGKLEELEKLDRTLKEGELKLRSIKVNIDSLTKEIDTFADLEAQLDQNVKCLKKKNIIAIAAEYKKAKEELAKTKAKAIGLRNDREQFKKACAEIEWVMKKAQVDLEKLQKTGDNNVLRGKFGKKENG